MKSRLMVFIIVLLIGLSSFVTAAGIEFDVSYNPMPFNLPSIVELEQQFFQEQGLVAKYNTFLVGHAMSEAMAAKELDIAPVMGGTSAITSYAGGRGIRIISVYSQAPSGFALIGQPETDIALGNLKGKRIAAPIGTEAHYLLGKILKEQDLTFADIELVNMLVPDGVTALQSGHIDGAMVVEPVLTKLVTNNKARLIRDGSGLIAGLTLSVARADLEQETIDKYLQAQAQSIAYINENLEQTLTYAAKETELPLAMVKKIAPKYSFSAELSEEVLESLQDTIDFLYEEGIIRKKITVEEML